MVASHLMLDTDILIDLSRQYAPALNWLYEIYDTPMPNICGFSAMEFLFGVSNSDQIRRARAFLHVFPIIWPSIEAMQRALNDFTPLHLSTGIGIIDSLIASTALDRDLSVVTFNKRHFDAVPGLRTIQPYER